MNYTNFLNDEEKMKDFEILTKEEFLQSYSYLTEEEYNLTKELYFVGKTVELSWTEDEDLNDFIEEQGGKVIVKVTCQECDNLWGDIVGTDGEELPYHFEIKDICRVLEGSEEE